MPTIYTLQIFMKRNQKDEFQLSHVLVNEGHTMRDAKGWYTSFIIKNFSSLPEVDLENGTKSTSALKDS